MTTVIRATYFEIEEMRLLMSAGVSDVSPKWEAMEPMIIEIDGMVTPAITALIVPTRIMILSFLVLYLKNR